MKPQLLLVGLSCIVSSASPALAVQPASVNANDDVAWSRVVENPFDGKIIYDRNYKADFVFVSSWSKKGIGVTYTQVRAAIVGRGYYPGYHRRGGLRGLRGFGGFGGFGDFFDDQPIYQRFLVDNVPDSINLAINGRVYTYQNGPVSPELAAALASAASEKVKIRLVWQDGSTKDTEIGKDTVRAWKEVFSPS